MNALRLLCDAPPDQNATYTNAQPDARDAYVFFVYKHTHTRRAAALMRGSVPPRVLLITSQPQRAIARVLY